MGEIEKIQEKLDSLRDKDNIDQSQIDELEETLEKISQNDSSFPTEFVSEFSERVENKLGVSNFNLTSMDDWSELDSKVQDKVYKKVSNILGNMSESIDEKREKIN